MELQILHLYPDLMNLYGSYANVSVLARLLERLGHTVKVKTALDSDGLSHADFLYMGAGTERRQRFAMEDFARYADAVKAAAGEGLPMFFAGTAMELLGESVTTADGETFAGVGLSAFTSVQGKRRIVGDVYGHTELFPESVVGFMNKCAVISGMDTPLLDSLELGFGNEAERGPEGFRRGNVFGSELTGPVLVKNPALLKVVAAAVLERRGVRPPDAFPLDEWAEQGYAVTERELKLRCQNKT